MPGCLEITAPSLGLEFRGLGPRALVHRYSAFLCPKPWTLNLNSKLQERTLCPKDMHASRPHISTIYLICTQAYGPVFGAHNSNFREEEGQGAAPMG